MYIYKPIICVIYSYEIKKKMVTVRTGITAPKIIIYFYSMPLEEPLMLPGGDRFPKPDRTPLD